MSVEQLANQSLDALAFSFFLLLFYVTPFTKQCYYTAIYCSILGYAHPGWNLEIT